VVNKFFVILPRNYHAHKTLRLILFHDTYVRRFRSFFGCSDQE